MACFSVHHVTPLLRESHDNFKVVVMIYKSLCGLGTQYLVHRPLLHVFAKPLRTDEAGLLSPRDAWSSVSEDFPRQAQLATSLSSFGSF